MSVAQEPFLSPTTTIGAPPAMDLNTMLANNRPAYDRYSALEESSSPQNQLPPPHAQLSRMETPTIVSTANGRIYR